MAVLRLISIIIERRACSLKLANKIRHLPWPCEMTNSMLCFWLCNGKVIILYKRIYKYFIKTYGIKIIIIIKVKV